MDMLVFKHKDILYGIENTAIQEINREITAPVLLGCASHIVGLYNMRGNVVLLLDIDAMMTGTAPELKEHYNGIILKSDGSLETHSKIGIVADQIVDIMKIDEETIENTPSSFTELQNTYIKKVAKVDKKILLVVDYDQLLKKEGE